MKLCFIFALRYYTDSTYQVYSNTFCLNNPVGQASSFWNGAGTGIAASQPGLFISHNAIPNAHTPLPVSRTPTTATIIPLPSPARLPQLYYFF
jgi:hypothetical protein